jgi:two-component system, cell cycle sensor histidine kinase and response regulator CckA
LDDDETIRELARKLLERDGYDVVTAAEGHDAIRACEDAARTAQPFALAVLDLTVVGGMGGEEALPHVRALMPNIAVIACSGYSENDALTHFSEHGFDAILPKPYTLEQFAKSVRLARRARAA